MESFESLLAKSIWNWLTYVVFFGLLAGLGVLEFVWEMKADGASTPTTAGRPILL